MTPPDEQGRKTLIKDVDGLLGIPEENKPEHEQRA